MINLPHLPAPSAYHDPLHGHAAHAARKAAYRPADQEPANAYSSNRLRRDPLRPEMGEGPDRSTEESQNKTQYYRDAAEVFGHTTTNFFFVQRFAQEEYPAENPAVAHGQATAAYPSLDFDDDILLPGDAVPLGWFGNPRLDILV